MLEVLEISLDFKQTCLYEPCNLTGSPQACSGVQWLSWQSIRQGIQGLLVCDSPLVDSLCCVLDQDTLSAA